MATVEELFSGRTETQPGTATSSTKPTAEIPFVVKDAADESAVKSAALAATPASYAGLPRKSIEIAERINETTWKVTVRYENESSGSPDNPEPVTSFDIGAGSQHITQSLQTVQKKDLNGVAADLGGAIGFDGENVNGVDITVPVWTWQETHYLDTVLTSAYYACTGKVNTDVFQSFQPGEVIFLGASGTKRGDGKWEVTFKFAASPNKTGIVIGGIAGIDKKGWEYLWVQYAADVDNAKKVLIKKPFAVYVEKVYEEASFASLGIG